MPEVITDSTATAAAPTKPILRGWIHAVMLPLALAASIVLVCLAPSGSAKISCAIFGFTAIMLFGCSALYHRGTWGPTATGVLRRMDHSNIALIIAGTYTPLAMLLLPPSQRVVLLWIVWVGAAAAIAVRVFWLQAPRWSYVPIYLALGWVAVAYLPQMWHSGGPAIVWLLIAGGLAYSAGAIVYGLRRPNPWPRVFGFHEVFHALTVAGFGCHFVAVAMAALG